MASLPWFFLPLAFLALIATATAISTTQFGRFLPQWNDRILEILRKSCEKELADYKTGNLDLIEGDGQSRLITPVIECILEEFPEFRKSELGSSAVVLGLLPMILSSFGSTVAEITVVTRRRPLLGLLLAIGSPGVTIVRGTEFVQTAGKLVYQPGLAPADRPPHRSKDNWPHQKVSLAIFEYAAAAIGAGLVMGIAVLISKRTIVVFAPATVYLLPLWVVTAAPIHFLGRIVLRTMIKSSQNQRDQAARPRRSSRLELAFLNEITPAKYQDPEPLGWRGDRLTYSYQFIKGILTIATVAHVVFGTLVFSSLIFLSVTDSLLVILLFAGGSYGSRGVVLLELEGLREQQGLSGQQEEGGQ